MCKIVILVGPCCLFISNFICFIILEGDALQVFRDHYRGRDKVKAEQVVGIRVQRALLEQNSHGLIYSGSLVVFSLITG